MPDLSAIAAPDPTAALFANLAARQNTAAPNVQAAIPPPPPPVGAVAQPSPNLAGAPAGLDQLIVAREGSGPQAISPKGAEGEHQVLPSTAVPYLYPGANPSDPAVQAKAKAALLDPATNQRVGRAVIADLWKKYRDPQAVMVAYNAGPAAADKWITSGKDPSVLPAETQKYIGAIDSDGTPSPNTQARTELKSQLAEVTRQTQAIIDQIGKEGGRSDDTLKQLQQLRDKQAEYQDAALQLARTPPVPNPRDAIQRFGGLATVVGILGGLFTKAPLTASLNAAGAAMEAYNKGDEATFKHQYDAWKINTDVMMKMAEAQHQALRDTLYDEHMQSSEKMARLQAVLSALGQERMATMAGLGQEHQLIQEELALGRTLDASRRTQAEIEHWRSEDEKAKAATEQRGWTILYDPTKTDGKGNPTAYRFNTISGEATTLDMKPYSPGGAQKMGTAAQAGGTPESIESTAQMIAHYQMAPLSGWVLRGTWGQQVMSRVRELNPDYQATEFGARSSAARAFTSGKQADTVRSFSVAIDHMEVAKDLGLALQNGDAQALNRLKNTLSAQMGYEGPVDFNFAKEIVGDEVTKAVAGGMLGVTDREHLKQSLDAANSPQQLLGVIQTAQRLMAGQLAGYMRQYNVSTGRTDFQQLLSPRAKAELEQYINMNQGELRGGAGGGTSGGPTSQLPAGIPAGSTVIGTYQGKPVYQTPDGKRLQAD